MKHSASVLALLLSAGALSGCFRYVGYEGDGTFRDNGWLNYSERYEVDLGEIDLAAPGEFRYTLRRLPRATFCIGLSAGIAVADPKSGVAVRLSLRASNGDLIVSEEAPLSSWVASTGYASGDALFYRKGLAREVPLPDGNSRPEKLNIRPSGGWGSYFDSDETAVYSLEVSIVSSEAPDGSVANLRLTGWGRE